MKENNIKRLFASIIFFWFAQYVYIPFQTPHLNAIGVSTSFVGVIVGAYGISQMILRLPVGVLADKSNFHKTFIITGGLSSGLASIFRVLMANDIGFLIGNLFSGLASAMWISFMVLYLSYYSKPEQQKATGKLIFANNLGMLMAFITGTLLYERLGMEMICTFGIASGFISAFYALGIQNETCVIRKKVDTLELLKVCLNKRLLFFSLLALIQQGVQMSTVMSFTSQIVSMLGGNSFVVGVISIIYMSSAVLWAKFSSSKTCAKMSSIKLIVLIFILTALYCVCVPLVGNIYWIALLQVLAGMSTGILFSLLNSQAMLEIEVNKKSTAMGFFQTVYALGMSVLPSMSGSISNQFGIEKAFFVLGAFCMAGAIIASLTKFFVENC